MAEVKIVTRTCITCQHEPEWLPDRPTSDILWGECHNQWRRLISLTGQVAKFDGNIIFACPAWKSKAIQTETKNSEQPTFSLGD